MRRISIKKNIIKFNTVLIILALYLSFNVLFVNNCNAQGENISIYITDLDNNPIEQITEGNQFKVSVYDPYLQIDMFLVNVTIEFDGDLYYITDSTPNSEITLTAPEVNIDKEIPVRAFKDDLDSETQITVLNKVELTINPQELIIDADKDFYVEVIDKTTGSPISGATVYISNIYNQQDTTNENGIVYLHSPKNRDEIRVIAQKEGYETSYVDLRVNIPKSFTDYIIENEYFIFFIAFIILISVVIYVHFRQKKSIYDRTQEITKEKQMEKYGLKDNSDESNKKDSILNKSSSMDSVRVKSDSNPKVEEIRISRKRKEKEIVPIDTKEDKMEKVLSKRSQIQKQEWFKGTDDVRYEIDKITGEIDEKGKDKWFEGIDDIREKIDKRIKKDKKNQDKEK